MSEFGSQHKKAAQDEEQTPILYQNQKRSFTKEWRNAGFIIVTLAIGGIIGYFGVPDNLSTIGMCIGGIVLCCIAGLSGHIIDDVRKSRRFLFWWIVSIFGVSITGAILGYVFLPSTLLVSSKLLFGALIGLAGLGFLIDSYQNGVALEKQRFPKRNIDTN